MARHLLGEPDPLRSNPHFDSAPRTRLYRLDRVETAEDSEEFRAVSAAAARRSAAARAAALRRRREVPARIAAEPIDGGRVAREDGWRVEGPYADASAVGVPSAEASW